MTHEITEHVRIILFATQHPGNIGASARAMKTMGLQQLCLVTPRGYPSAEATIRASGADDILARAQVFDNLPAAIQDCAFVIGTSARVRNIAWPLLDPEAAAWKILQQAETGMPVAVVFGPERTGLSNAELDLCHAVVTIPVNPVFPSLNLAAAVQVISYELRKAVLAGADPPPASTGTSTPVSAEQMQQFYEHLERYLVATGYYHPGKPRLLMRRLRRMFNRMQPDQGEYNILRGILAAVSPPDKE